MNAFARASSSLLASLRRNFGPEMEECPMRGERDRWSGSERERERGAGKHQTCSNSYSERSAAEREKLKAGNAVVSF